MNRRADALLDFINRELLSASGGSCRAALDTLLFDDGLIDSLKILRLIAFVETATGRAIPDEEIVMAYFRTPRVIAEHFFQTETARV